MNMSFGTTGMMRSLASSAAYLVLAGLMGCGGGSGSDKATVIGKVSYSRRARHRRVRSRSIPRRAVRPYPVAIKADGTFNVSGVPRRADGGSDLIPAPARGLLAGRLLRGPERRAAARRSPPRSTRTPSPPG